MSNIFRINSNQAIALGKEPGLPFWVYGDSKCEGKKGEITILKKGPSISFLEGVSIDGVEWGVLFLSDKNDDGTGKRIPHLVCDENLDFYIYVIGEAYSYDYLNEGQVYIEDGTETMTWVREMSPLFISTDIFEIVQNLDVLTKERYLEMTSIPATNTCVRCGYNNPYMDPIPGYTCRKCSVMMEWAAQ